MQSKTKEKIQMVSELKNTFSLWLWLLVGHEILVPQREEGNSL